MPRRAHSAELKRRGPTSTKSASVVKAPNKGTTRNVRSRRSSSQKVTRRYRKERIDVDMEAEPVTMFTHLHGALEGSLDDQVVIGDPDARARLIRQGRYATTQLNTTLQHRRATGPITPLDGSLPLYTFEELPHWMQDNPFIRTGYRAHYSVSMCIRSLFKIHNEFGNIWTHLLGLIFFFFFSVYAFIELIKPVLMHYVIFFFFSLGCCMCMGCSALYHLFAAHHCERVFSRMIMMDYFGITCLIIASFYPICYYAFVCDNFWRWTYMGMVTALGSVGLIGPFFDFFHSDSFKWPRLFIFCSLTSIGLFPAFHVTFLLPAKMATPMVQGMALMLGLYGIGVVIYVLKLPERLYPGRFDIWFHSHQLWHVFVLAASVVHLFTSFEVYKGFSTADKQC